MSQENPESRETQNGRLRSGPHADLKESRTLPPLRLTPPAQPVPRKGWLDSKPAEINSRWNPAYHSATLSSAGSAGGGAFTRKESHVERSPFWCAGRRLTQR